MVNSITNMSQPTLEGAESLKLKCLLVGDDGVGKTCLLRQFTDRTFQEENQATIGVDFTAKNVEVDGKSARLQLWDTAGQERFRSISPTYYRGAHIALVVYDVTNPKSLTNARDRLEEAAKLGNDNVIRVLVGNKCDLSDKRKVSAADGKALADSLQILFHEVSAKSAAGVDEIFKSAIRECMTDPSSRHSTRKTAAPDQSAVGPRSSPQTDVVPKSGAKESGASQKSADKTMKPQQGFDHVVKLVAIGNAGVGKSCLLLQYADKTFTESYVATIGVDFKIKTIQLDGKTVKLQLWDTAGLERFRSITSAYYVNAHAIIVVYDVADLESFNDVSRVWLNEIQRFAGDKVVRLLVGNKRDLTDLRKISTADGKALADSLQIPFYEVSAKSAVGIDEMFETAVRKCIDQSNLTKSSPDNRTPSKSLPAGTSASSNTIATASVAEAKVSSPMRSSPSAGVVTIQGDYDYLLKLLVVGNAGVGKSSIMLQYADHEFTDNYIATIGIDFKVKTVHVAGKTTRLQMESFIDVSKVWLNELQQYANDKVVRVLAANKCDLTDQRKVSTADGQALADRLQIPFYEVSAKSVVGIDEMFKTAVREFMIMNLAAIEQRKAPASARPSTQSKTCILL